QPARRPESEVARVVKPACELRDRRFRPWCRARVLLRPLPLAMSISSPRGARSRKHRAQRSRGDSERSSRSRHVLVLLSSLRLGPEMGYLPAIDRRYAGALPDGRAYGESVKAGQTLQSRRRRRAIQISFSQCSPLTAARLSTPAARITSCSCSDRSRARPVASAAARRGAADTGG